MKTSAVCCRSAGVFAIAWRPRRPAQRAERAGWSNAEERPVTDQRSLVVLTYGNGKHIFADWGPRPTANLQTFIIELSASSFFDPSSGTPLDVTEAQFAEAMADLKQLFILGDWTGFIDTSRLDNVILAGPAASSVPEPGTWAMMIGGLGIVGASLRSRRRKLARV
jgi:glycine/D-amino acid oxidase-like deaminating enzyme